MSALPMLRPDAMSRPQPQPQPQPDHAPAIQHFVNFVTEKSVKGTHGPSPTVNRPFMPLRRLRIYLEEQDRRRTKDILQALFPTDDRPIEPEEIAQRCPRVFAILLCIGKGQFIGHFAHYGNLRDNKLPFEACPSHFPTTSEEGQFWESFYRKQWQFCPHIFQYDTDAELEKECILPIIHKERLAEGGSAVAYKIKLHRMYDQLITSERNQLDSSERFANTYVLKTYRTKDAYAYYKSEVDAFKKLAPGSSSDSSIIGFYGSYIQDETYNVLLEYADKGNLEEYFQRTQPPSTCEDIVKFWRSLFNVLKALSRIHEVRRTSATGPQIFQGWHQDVKPANILIVKGRSDSPYDYEFKLADLGLSHFQRTMEPQLDDLGRDNNGTREYGAPECYRRDEFIEQSKLEVPRSVDIWSLGCTYSEAAVWVVLGSDGLADYRRKRKAETDRIYNFRDGGCFHDGVKVLDTVQNFHAKARENIRKNDIVTEGVLDMVGDMLMAATNSRPTAHFLYDKSCRILQAAQDSLKSPKLKPQPSLIDHRSLSLVEDRPKTPPELPPELLHTRSDPSSQTLGPKRWVSQKDPLGSRSAERDVLTRERSSSPDKMTDADEESPHSIPNFGSSPQTSPPDARHMDRAGGPGRAAASGNPQYALQEGTNQYEDPFVEHGKRRSTRNSAAYGPKTHDITQAGHKAQASMSSDQSARHNPFPSHQPFLAHENNGQGHRGAVSDQPVYHQSNATPSPPPRGAKSELLERKKSTDPPPRLKVEAANTWIRQKEGGARVAPLANQVFLNDLNRRDHVFLIDDAASMQKHWSKVISVFYVLAYMVKDSDPDGMDLLYTVSLERQKSKKPDRLWQHLNAKACGGRTDITLRLSTILHEYATALQEQATPRRFLGSFLKKKEVRPMSLYIFTDAVWQPRCNAAAPIKLLIKKLDELGLPGHQVGIQFIRFGQNQESIDRLEYLDSGLELSRDIVDSEPSDGNVWKMLLGATNKWFDEDEVDIDNNKAYG